MKLLRKLSRRLWRAASGNNTVRDRRTERRGVGGTARAMDPHGAAGVAEGAHELAGCDLSGERPPWGSAPFSDQSAARRGLGLCNRLLTLG